MRYSLVPHRSIRETRFFAVEAEVRRAEACLVFRYRVIGDIAALFVPPPAPPLRTDDLWRTTCFEAFIRPGAGEGYVEFNFSPSMRWATYRFASYRAGMTNAEIGEPVIRTARDGRRFDLEATVDISPLGLTPSARLGLTAVIEDKSGATSFWALAHRGDQPDFHRADGFIARLPGRTAS